MKGDITGKMSKAEARTDWRRLRAMTDEELHAAIVADPEIKPTDETFWKTAKVVIPQAKGAHLDQHFKRSVTIICFEACWVYRYQTAIEKLCKVEAVGTDFFRVSLIALADAHRLRLIRLLDESSRTASFWYLHRTNQKIVNSGLRFAHLDLRELQELSGKLRDIRNKVFIHIDKRLVSDPQKPYGDAGIDRNTLGQVCRKLWVVMQEIYRVTHCGEFKHDEYDGEDIILLELRDGIEAGKMSIS